MAKPTSPMPKWGWLFVGLCILIPIVALGGAIPGGLGGGGAMICYTIAKQEHRPTNTRVGLCILTTVVCWGLFILLISQSLARLP